MEEAGELFPTPAGCAPRAGGAGGAAVSDDNSSGGGGCGCLGLLIFVLVAWAWLYGLPTTWGVLHIDIFPPGVYLR